MFNKPFQIRPFFLSGSCGSLFAVHYAPQDKIDTKIYLLHVPAFAEEMNKSRRMVAMQAQNLAAIGINTLVLDLFGTGDSQGDFNEARWDIWINDIKVALDWIHEQKAEGAHLWGLRLGCLLAVEAASKYSRDYKISSVLMWQPILNGDIF